jgi:DNA-binding response OmpR family regulator
MNHHSNLFMLAVDDEMAIQQILRHYFKNNFTVVTQGNAKDALLYMQEGSIPDVIVADIDMPEMSGYEFIDHIRSSGFLKNIPLIMLSGNDTSETRIRCLEAGADDFMVKPFNPRELAARVNGLLRRSGKQTAVKSIAA